MERGRKIEGGLRRVEMRKEEEEQVVCIVHKFDAVHSYICLFYFFR